MTTTTIRIDSTIRDRLRRYGHAGMTFNEILQTLMDSVDRDQFVAEMRRRAGTVTGWIDLEAGR